MVHSSIEIGLMDQFMKGNGYIVRHMVLENSSILMGMCMRVNGSTIKRMGQEFTLGKMAEHIVVSGGMTFKKVMGSKNGTLSKFLC